jgi:hypothetical protein
MRILACILLLLPVRPNTVGITTKSLTYSKLLLSTLEFLLLEVSTGAEYLQLNVELNILLRFCRDLNHVSLILQLSLGVLKSN